MQRGAFFSLPTFVLQRVLISRRFPSAHRMGWVLPNFTLIIQGSCWEKLKLIILLPIRTGSFQIILRNRTILTHRSTWTLKLFRNNFLAWRKNMAGRKVAGCLLMNKFVSAMFKRERIKRHPRFNFWNKRKTLEGVCVSKKKCIHPNSLTY